MSSRDALLPVSVACAGIVALLFIAWWNWRQYVWFRERGMSDPVAALIVFGPFAVVLFWLLWRYVRSKR